MITPLTSFDLGLHVDRPDLSTKEGQLSCLKYWTVLLVAWLTSCSSPGARGLWWGDDGPEDLWYRHLSRVTLALWPCPLLQITASGARLLVVLLPNVHQLLYMQGQARHQASDRATLVNDTRGGLD